MTEFLTGEYQHLLIALFYAVVLGLVLGARYLDKKNGHDGAFWVTTTTSKTTLGRPKTKELFDD